MSAPTAQEPVGTSRRHTSEPRWPLERPAVDPSARAIILVAGADEAAQASLLAWRHEANRAGISATVCALDEPAIEAAVSDALTGTRLLVAGNESTLALATAIAERSGWARSEVAGHLTDPDGPRPVQCVHCRAITHTTEAVDATCTCAGCGVPLLIFPHYSRRIGAYLGFRADAEELPA